MSRRLLLLLALSALRFSAPAPSAGEPAECRDAGTARKILAPFRATSWLPAGRARRQCAPIRRPAVDEAEAHGARSAEPTSVTVTSEGRLAPRRLDGSQE